VTRPDEEKEKEESFDQDLMQQIQTAGGSPTSFCIASEIQSLFDQR
jgi:hypothetical protein